MPAAAQKIPAQATLANSSRETPLIGFNAIGHLVPNGNWLNQAFTDSAAVLNPGILRYPGGTNANYWDWQTGWFMPAFPPPNPVYITPAVFKTALQATNSQGIYVLNYRNSDINYQMAFLRHLNNTLGIVPEYIEIGNEHNLTNNVDPNQYVNPTTYGMDCKVWCDSIKNIFPAAKICLVGGSPGSINNWHQPILNQNPNFEAFAWHNYINANNADLVFDVNKALATAFSSMSGRFTFANFPPNKEIWATEYNLWETQTTSGGSSMPVIAYTWTHTLYLTAMHHFMLTKPEIKMFLNHALTSTSNSEFFAAIDRNDLKITANGVAMKLLLDVAKGTTTTQQINFSPNQTITSGPTTFSKLIGWKFSNSNTENGFICNFSSDTFNISFASAFQNNMAFSAYSADTAFVVNGISSLQRFEGSSVDSIVILPFSITQISPATILAVEFLDPIRAYPVTDGIQVEWATASETNCDRFEVERSSDGTDFEKIGALKSSGSDNTGHVYRFKDKAPANGLNYYRIKEIDVDERYSWSKIVAARYDEFEIVLFPNPVRDVIHFQSSEPILRVTLLNILGNTIKTWTDPPSVLNLSDLPNGLYTLKFTDKTQREVVKKIIKIR